MIGAFLLKDKNGHYLTTTEDKNVAVRFENPDIVNTLADLLKLQIEEVHDEESVKENAVFINNW